MEIAYSVNAQAHLKKLPKNIGERIHKKVRWFGAQKDPLDFAEPLQHPFHSLYRFRIGDYRVIFSVQGKHLVILVLAVQHRKEAYR